MSKEWLIGLSGSVVIALVLQVLVRFLRKGRLDWLGIRNAVLSLIGFAIYLFFEGGEPTAFGAAPIGHKLVLTAAVLFGFSGIWRALLWSAGHWRTGELYLPPFLLRLFGWLLFGIVALTTAHQVFGVKLTGVLITSTVASAVIGLSLQSLLANLFAGIALQMERNFAIGDWVQVGGKEGKILRQDWRSITLLSLEEDLIILPNTMVAKEAIVNHMHPAPVMRLDTTLCVGQEYPPGAVKACMLATLKTIPELLKEPAPSVHMREFDDLGIKYQARFWIEDMDQRSYTRDIVLTRLWYALRRAGFAVSLSTQISEVKLHPTEAHELAQRAARTSILRCLREMTLFGFNDEQLDLLADAASLEHYTKGEALVKQGEDGDSLLIIEGGRVAIYARNVEGEEVEVDARHKGEFFGEMSLLTGDRRSASAIATEETSVVVIGKAAFATVLTADPAILSLMLDALESRRTNMASQLAASPAKPTQSNPAQRSRLLHNISRFLGISLD